VTARKALRLALRSVVEEKVDPFDYQLDRDLDLCWLAEFCYKISPLVESITYPEVFADGSVAPVPTQAELEQSFYRPPFVSPSDPDHYRPQLSATIRSHFPPELQQEVLVQLGPQGICEVIVACFDRDKAWDDICVRPWRSLSGAGCWPLCERPWRTTGSRPGLQTTISGGRTRGRALLVRSGALLGLRVICSSTQLSGATRGSLGPGTRSTLLRPLGILLLHHQGLLGRGVEYPPGVCVRSIVTVLDLFR
jgi:hypothetical protein